MRILLIFLLMTGIAYAEDFVTYDPGTGAYQGCRSYGDTNVPLSDPNNLASVRSGYVYANPFCASVLPSVPEQYRKVVAGVVTEMTQAEKDIVDAPGIAAAALAASYQTEISTNDLCEATLAQIASRIDSEKATIDTAISGASNIAGVKTVLLDMNTRYAAAFKKIGKCVRARIP